MNKIEKNYKLLKKSINKEDILTLDKAFFFATKKYNQEKNITGELMIIYVLKSSLTLIRISKNIDLIISCLLSKVLDFSSEKEIIDNFGYEISKLVLNITEISNIKYNEGEIKKNLQLFHNIFKKSGNDIRFFLIKICLRINNIQDFGILKNEIKKNIAIETLDIYIPIIKNFGLAKYFHNIEDSCYKIIKPNEYNKIEKILLKEKNIFNKRIKKIDKSIKKIAKKNKIEIEIESRIKSIYSISKKMENKKIAISGIYDLIAFRIITNKKRESYLFLGLIHSIFKNKDNRIKDYISSPKPNGYQSLHTTLFDDEGYIFEVQIQTKEMYEFNIFGIAAHNNYKGFSEKSTIIPEWLKIFNSKQKKQLFKNIIIDSFDINIFTDRINCYTPTKDKIELPKGASIIDFAFKIHSKLGNRINGAWINGEYIENLTQNLKNGDIVNLNISKEELEYPIEYISFLKTNIAKKNFKNLFKNKSIKKTKYLGKYLLNKEMELFGYKSFEKIPLIIQKKIIKIFNLKNIEDIYFNIGKGKISITKIMNIIYNFKYDETKYKNIVGLKIIFKKKSAENINKIFEIFHNLDINIVNIIYKGIYTTAEINVKNLSLLRNLLIEISRMPNVFIVKRIMSSKFKKFIILLVLAFIWIIISPLIINYIQKYSLFSEFLYKLLFYINITFFIYKGWDSKTPPFYGDRNPILC